MLDYERYKDDWVSQEEKDAASMCMNNDMKQEACLVSKGVIGPYYLYISSGIWYHSGRDVLRCFRNQGDQVQVVGIYMNGQSIYDVDLDSAAVADSVSQVQL